MLDCLVELSEPLPEDAVLLELEAIRA
jgi:hypothetical protein